jgi:hypothetical protein
MQVLDSRKPVVTQLRVVQVNRRYELYINIKNCKALLKKVVIGRAVTAVKQQKSKGN